jgi:hypothetical protein
VSRRAKVLRLPDRGTLLVCTDLQGNLRDFEQMVRHFRAAGDDAVLVLTGDLVHGPDQATVDDWPEHLGTPYTDESPKLIDAFLAEQARAQGRVHCLLGNHDHAHAGGPVTKKFHPDERAALESRLDAAGVKRLREMIAAFPLAAVSRCGAVLLHAAPSAPIDSAADLEAVELEGYEGMDFRDFLARSDVLAPMIWSRMAKADQAQRLLKALGGTVAIFGHDVVREGWAADSDEQLCVSTSFGCFDAQKVYVQLDLAARYASVKDLREGTEIKKLYP